MYNRLFNFLDNIISKLSNNNPSKGKYNNEPNIIYTTIEKGREKLRKYYS